jgi:YbbR domain-containing protein
MRINLRHNVYLKIFSFLLALVCWFVVSSEEDRVKDFAVPIDYVRLPDSMELSGKVIDTVAVRLRASEPILRNVTEDQLSARIDLSRIPLGEQHVPVTSKMIKTPRGASVVRIEPALIPLHIEKRVQREVPVVAEFSGRPAAGHAKGKHVIDPSVVTIEGPASEVARVKRATTGTISLDGETEDYDVEVTPIPDAGPGARVRIIAPPGPVRVHVSISPVSDGRTDTISDGTQPKSS